MTAKKKFPCVCLPCPACHPSEAPYCKCGQGGHSKFCDPNRLPDVVGARIVAIRAMTEAEMLAEGCSRGTTRQLPRSGATSAERFTSGGRDEEGTDNRPGASGSLGLRGRRQARHETRLLFLQRGGGAPGVRVHPEERVLVDGKMVGPLFRDSGKETMSKDDAVYLGDGLYAEDEGFQVVLHTERKGGRHWVALDGDVLTSLLRFIERRWNLQITVSQKAPKEEL